MKHLLVMVLLNIAASAVAQTNLQRKIESIHQKGIPFQATSLFSWKGSKSVAGKGVYQELETNVVNARTMMNAVPYAIALQMPISSSKSIEAELVYEFLSDYKVKVDNNAYTTEYIRPVHYRGIVKNSTEASNVILTISETFISLSVSYGKKHYTYIQKKQGSASREMVLYSSSEINLPWGNARCGLDEITVPKTPLLPEILLGKQQPQAASDKCIYGYLDCTNSLYIDRGSSVQNCIDYITAIYNDVATAYQNESINAKISEINIWKTADPFLHTTRDTALYTFASYYKNNFYGNFAVMLERAPGKGISGKAGAIGAMKSFMPNTCGKFIDDPVNKYMGNFCICDMNYFGEYSNYPVPANDEQVYIITHEIGHLVAGRHTHDGGYVVSTSPTVYGSLDTCGANVHPTVGLDITNGTFMSYCISGNAGMNMNFNAGFGTQPGNEIRNFVSNETCLDNCVACVLNITITNLPGGYSRYEVSNSITARGTIPATGVAYLDGGNFIDLKPGFQAVPGSRVVVLVDGCSGIR